MSKLFDPRTVGREPDAVDVIDNALSYLTPERWTKNAEAVNAVHQSPTFVGDPDAHAYCTVGVLKFAGLLLQTEADTVQLAHRLVYEAMAKRMSASSIPNGNDAEATTYEDVVLCLKEGRELGLERLRSDTPPALPEPLPGDILDA